MKNLWAPWREGSAWEVSVEILFIFSFCGGLKRVSSLSEPEHFLVITGRGSWIAIVGRKGSRDTTTSPLSGCEMFPSKGVSHEGAYRTLSLMSPPQNAIE